MYGMGRGYLLTVDRGFQTPLIYQDCPILLTSPYCSFVFCCLVSLAEWVIAPHLTRFPKQYEGGGRKSPSVARKMGNFAVGESFIKWVGIWQGMILTIWTIFKAKKHSVNIEYRLKSKLAWLVCAEYKLKIKIVQEQWLQLKMKFFLDYNKKIVI